MAVVFVLFLLVVYPLIAAHLFAIGDRAANVGRRAPATGRQDQFAIPRPE